MRRRSGRQLELIIWYVCLRVYRVVAAASMFIDTARTVRGSRGSSERRMRRVGANDVLMLLPRPSRPISVETTYILFIGLANLLLRNMHASGTTRNPHPPLLPN